MTTPAARGPLFLVLHQSRYELIGILRNRQARFFTIALPVIFLFIFVGIFGNHEYHGVKLSTTYVPGLSALGVISSSFINLVISITVQREEGILKRRRATPVPAWVLIVGRTFTAVCMSLAVVAVLVTIGRFVFGVSLRVAAIPGIAFTIIIGSITFCVLGYAFSTVIHSEDAAQPMVQATMLPLYFISGIFISNDSIPHWLQQVALVFPVAHLADGLRNAYSPLATGVGIVWVDIGVMALWAAGGLTIALWRFSWVPGAASS
jgi:ABC-2 type transport system permease protein